MINNFFFSSYSFDVDTFYPFNRKWKNIKHVFRFSAKLSRGTMAYNGLLIDD